jgi:ABC-type nickel/cobalt efflux system permease component RcnA
MAQRLSAFVLAVVFGTVPVIAQICDAKCAQHVGHVAAQEEPPSHHQHPDHEHGADHHHTSHHHPISDTSLPRVTEHQLSHDGMLVTDLSSGCSQPHAVASESREVLRKPTAGCVLATVIAPTNLMSALSSSDAGVATGPSVPARFISPLRI